MAGVFLCLSSLAAFQKEFRVYLSLERYDNVELPPDADEKTEFVFARLMFPSTKFTRYSPRFADWRLGGTSWSEDYPRADRHFMMALRRLTRIHARSVEQPVNPDDGDDIFNWPMIYAGLPGDWDLTDAQAAKLREYFGRGGYFLADDFWGTPEWNPFMDGIHKIFGDREPVDLPNNDALFHISYDLNDRYQVLGDWGLRGGRPYRNDGDTPYWRGIYDDKKRVMVAIVYNSDLGDSWEWADSPLYPEKYSALGIRIGVNYVLYGMTH